MIPFEIQNLGDCVTQIEWDGIGTPTDDATVCTSVGDWFTAER